MLLVFLHVKYNKEMTSRQKIKRIDYLGNVILIASTVAILYALTYSGTRYSWSSWHVLVPLVLGLVGLGCFMLFETSPLVVELVVPPRLFAKRTSAIVFVIKFLNSALLCWVLFFLPVYFQTVLGSSPARSGVQVLPIIVVAVPAAIVAVLLLTKLGKYKPLHLIGFAVCTIGLGLFTLFDASSMAEWVIFQMITGGGSGFVLSYLPAKPALWSASKRPPLQHGRSCAALAAFGPSLSPRLFSTPNSDSSRTVLVTRAPERYCQKATHTSTPPLNL